MPCPELDGETGEREGDGGPSHHCRSESCSRAVLPAVPIRPGQPLPRRVQPLIGAIVVSRRYDDCDSHEEEDVDESQ